MNKKEDSIQEIKKILAPIKERPKIEPRPKFVQDLQTKIATRKNQKQMIFLKMPIMAIGMVVLLTIVLSLSFVSKLQPENSGEILENPFPILEHSQVNLIMEVGYGDQENQVGIDPKGPESNNVSSFAVYDGTFYILDNFNNKVLIIDAQGNYRTIPIDEAKHLVDILVTNDKEIYVLDSGQKLVYQFSNNGELINTFEISVEIPTGLVYMKEYGVTVNQLQGRVELVETGERIPAEDLPYREIRVSEVEGEIWINDNGENIEIEVDFEHFYGGLTFQSITENQVVFTKTEREAEFTTIEPETHVYIVNKHGSTLGAVRIPSENMEISASHLVKTDGNKIYLLSPEASHLAIYELIPGKSFEKLLDDRIKEQQPEREKIGFDYKTYGEPHPELEQDIAQLFTNKTIFASYSNEPLLNGVSIDKDGTLIVDFKDFNEPAPSTAEKKEIFEALSETVFKYFEVKKAYFQFDGSFSDWCYWLETMEEPMIRPTD
ncbi:hypothetical protein [Bacillus sp. CHD6a]|uniref:hypothetical protein n=1 Tax=Bacillus sp. CHD6a TaxID=1643452 RepID=UPI0006CD8698|nr:hypothetical protein [Bacillus sp. CHD6a]KPB03764.1 hypothetical protein AAV98_15800 [Bacillus sp. CHD6a]